MAQLKFIFHPANEAQDVVWVMGNFGPSMKMANTFKTFMWDMSVCFIRPIQELRFIFNIVCIDILCGQHLSGVTQMFQCVKEAPEDMNRGRRYKADTQ